MFIHSFIIYFLTYYNMNCRFLRDLAYDNIANNRYSVFGRTDTCEIEKNM